MTFSINGAGENDITKIKKLTYPRNILFLSSGSTSGTGGCFIFTIKYKINAQNSQPLQPMPILNSSNESKTAAKPITNKIIDEIAEIV